MLQIPAPFGGRSFIYLMHFMDGNRIDLSIKDITLQIPTICVDSDKQIILDKDGVFAKTPPVNQEQYNIQPPSKKHFEDYCNEFWWMQLNIGKGLLRYELPYAMGMLEYTRNVFQQMITWDIGLKYNFKVSTGKLGKYIEKYLTKVEWSRFIQTYPSGDYEQIWNCLLVMQKMFRASTIRLAEQFGFCYPYDDDKSVCKMLGDL